jgi:hypothetical protein
VLFFCKSDLADLPRIILQQHARFIQGDMLLLMWCREFSCGLMTAPLRVDSLRTLGNAGYGMRTWCNGVVQNLPKPARLKKLPYLNVGPLTEQAAK